VLPLDIVVNHALANHLGEFLHTLSIQEEGVIFDLKRLMKLSISRLSRAPFKQSIQQVHMVYQQVLAGPAVAGVHWILVVMHDYALIRDGVCVDLCTLRAGEGQLRCRRVLGGLLSDYHRETA
jgi:hypothetical protein